MMCDIMYASPTAVFGQPEIKLGVIPGAGGSQRLTRALGKSKAMELILTGRNLSAEEAHARGLVADIYPKDQLVSKTVEIAKEISQFSRIAVKAAKEVVNESFEHPLSQGVKVERRLFHALFGTEDQKEGMAAFAEKRKPSFVGK